MWLNISFSEEHYFVPSLLILTTSLFLKKAKYINKMEKKRIAVYGFLLN